MCGLVGVAGKLTSKEERALKELLVVDSIRGQHSTGIASVNTKGETAIVKQAVAPNDFFQWQPFKNVLTKQNNVLIGHNRWATKGAVNNINAHPFECGDIIGVHNGTLHNQKLLPNHADFEVDSENIMHSIDQLGVEATHEVLDGAFALVWWDVREEKLHFLRNKERPFFYTFNKENNVIFWASEKWMLSGVLGRKEINIEHGPILETSVNTEYVIDVPIEANWKDYPQFGIESKTKLEPYVKPPIVVHNKHNGKRNNVKYLPSANKQVNSNNGNRVAGAPPIKKNLELSQGSEIVFSIEKGSCTNEVKEFKGWICGDQSVEVCVKGVATTNPMYNLLYAEDGKFTAIVNSFQRFNDHIWRVIVQGNSVKKYDWLQEEASVVKPFKVDGEKVFMTKAEFEEKTNWGCAMCHDDVDFAEEVTFNKVGEAFCYGCTSLPFVVDYLSFDLNDLIQH